MKDTMDSEMKLTTSRIAGIDAELASLRGSHTRELAAAIDNLGIDSTRDLAALIAGAKIAIAPVRDLAALVAEAKIAIAPVHNLALAMADVRLNIQQVLVPFQETINMAVGAVKLVHDFHSEMQRSVEEWMGQQQLSWARMAEMVSSAALSFEVYRNVEAPEACAVLCQAGWLRMDRHFSIVELRESLVLHKTQGEAAMNDAILEYFSEDNYASLERMTKSWESVPYLRDRNRIIADALFAHRSGLYTLTIPTLMPFVDGLSAEILGSTTKNAVAKFAQDRRANDPEIWVQGFCDFMADVFYKGYQFGKDSAPYLNRHAILHGRVFDYPSALNSTRVFLLLDALADFWHERLQALAPTTIQ
jgi:hypothetical protein